MNTNCKFCGASLPEGAIMCPSCGKATQEQPTTPVAEIPSFPPVPEAPSAPATGPSATFGGAPATGIPNTAPSFGAAPASVGLNASAVPGAAPYGQAPQAPVPQQPYGQAPQAPAVPGVAPYGQTPPQAPMGQPAMPPYGQALQAPMGQPSYGQQPYGQAPIGQPGMLPPMPYPVPAAKGSPTMGILSLVIAIICFLIAWYFSLLIGALGSLAAIGLGAAAIKQNGGKGMGIAGIIIGAITVLLWIIL